MSPVCDANSNVQSTGPSSPSRSERAFAQLDRAAEEAGPRLVRNALELDDVVTIGFAVSVPS